MPSFAIICAVLDNIRRFLVVHDNKESTFVPNLILVSATSDHFPTHTSVRAHECVTFIVRFQMPADIAHPQQDARGSRRKDSPDVMWCGD